MVALTTDCPDDVRVTRGRVGAFVRFERIGIEVPLLGSGGLLVSRALRAEPFSRGPLALAIDAPMSPRGTLVPEVHLRRRLHDAGCTLVPPVLEHDRSGVEYFVTELLDGVRLDKVIARLERGGALPIPIALKLVRPMAELLRALELLGDVEWGTVSIHPWRVHVLWTGDVRFSILVDTMNTGSGRRFGSHADSVRYFSREQRDGERATGRSAIYCVGRILLELLRGPVDARLPDSDWLHELPVEVAEVLARTIALDPDDRYPNAAVLLESMEAACAAEPGSHDDVAGFLRAFMEPEYSRHRTRWDQYELIDSVRDLVPAQPHAASQAHRLLSRL